MVVWPDAPASFPAVSWMFLLRNQEGRPWALGAGGKNLTPKRPKRVVLFPTIAFSYSSTRSCWKVIWMLYIFPTRELKKPQKWRNRGHADGEEDVEQWRQRISRKRDGYHVWDWPTGSRTLLTAWYASHAGASVRRPNRYTARTGARGRSRRAQTWVESGRRCGCGSPTFTPHGLTLDVLYNLSELLFLIFKTCAAQVTESHTLCLSYVHLPRHISAYVIFKMQHCM